MGNRAPGRIYKMSTPSRFRKASQKETPLEKEVLRSWRYALKEEPEVVEVLLFREEVETRRGTKRRTSGSWCEEGIVWSKEGSFATPVDEDQLRSFLLHHNRKKQGQKHQHKIQ